MGDPVVPQIRLDAAQQDAEEVRQQVPLFGAETGDEFGFPAQDLTDGRLDQFVSGRGQGHLDGTGTPPAVVPDHESVAFGARDPLGDRPAVTRERRASSRVVSV